MRAFQNNFTRWHAIVFALIWLSSTALTYWIANAGVDDGPDHNRQVAQTTALSISGPLVGAISRDMQGCCLRASMEIMPYSAALLAGGVFAQFLRLPPRRSSGKKAWLAFTVRMTLWIAGLLAWFVGGLVSFGHALS